MDFRTKSSNHAYLLLALVPIPSFIYNSKAKQDVVGVWEARLIHECLDFVVAPLKKAAEVGVMMNDPLGYRRYCFTPLAGYIVDTPESQLLAGVKGNTSSVTTASDHDFGDSFRHPPRTGTTTLRQLQAMEALIDPMDIVNYIYEAKARFRLLGVHKPFWRDWPLSDPTNFLTPEPLHHWHKAFWDHDVKWCIKAVGWKEIDFRFHVLHPHTSYRHFKEGISKIKQVTGREHRDIQRYIVGVISGQAPRPFVVAIRALNDFRYLAQSPVIDDDMCNMLLEALKEFHDHKDAIMASGARLGKRKKNKAWGIPKLEFLQSVVPSIRANGVASQWSADATEHAHITEVKTPARSTNNQNYEPQIVRHLDRADKVRRFGLLMAMLEAQVEFHSDDSDDEEDPELDPQVLTTTSALLSKIGDTGGIHRPTRVVVDYFATALQLSTTGTNSTPHRTVISNPNIAFHLTRDANFKCMSVEDVVEKYGIPDLRDAISDYLTHCGWISSIGSHRAPANPNLTGGEKTPLVTHLNVWTRVRIQQKAYHYPHNNLPPETVNVIPPSKDWPLGCYDAVLVNTDSSKEWPSSGIQGMYDLPAVAFSCHIQIWLLVTGHVVGQIHLIFHIIPTWDAATHATPILSYAQGFDFVPQINHKISGSSNLKGVYPEPSTMQYVLK
ncbi:hypothetical protein DXG01_010888 [Tephrocybe rancida]|nr:hypothetical protein DXG01_010888 [Tephrocybe rancida]